MKRFLTVLLCLALFLSLSGFTSADAYATYEAAQKAAESLQSCEGTLSATIDTIDTSAKKSSIALTGTYKQVMRSSTDVDLLFDMDMEMEGQTVSMQMIYKGGYMYSSLSTGDKFKQKLPLDQAMQQANLVDSGSLGFTEESVKSAEMTELDNGMKKLTFVLDKDFFTNTFAGTDTASLFSGMRFGDMKMTVWVNESGIPIQEYMAFAMTMAGDNSAVTMTYRMTLTITGVNTVGGISLPADADSYAELEI